MDAEKLRARCLDQIAENRDRLLHSIEEGSDRISFKQVKAAYLGALLVEFATMHFINTYDVQVPLQARPRQAYSALRMLAGQIPMIMNHLDSNHVYSMRIDRKPKKRKRDS